MGTSELRLLRDSTRPVPMRVGDRFRRALTCAAAISAALLSPTGVAAQYYAPDPPPADVPWYELVELDAFVDAYGAVNYNFPRPQTDANIYRAYDQNTSFALSWVGLNAHVSPEPVGGTISLRFGPSAEQLANRCLHENRELNPCDSDVGLGLETVAQAYASWRPGGAVGPFRLDFGKFDSIYGMETAEAQRNANYTRGLLYTLAQPVFHTGLRANVKPLPDMELNLLAVNGQNATLDNNFGKTFGAQLVLAPTPSFSMLLGWLAGPEQDDSAEVACGAGFAYSPEQGVCAPDPNAPVAATYGVSRGGANSFSAFRHHGDLVVLYRPSSMLSVGFDAIYGFEGVRQGLVSSDTETERWWGGTLIFDLPVHRIWSVALRAEYLNDPQGRLTNVDGAELASGTLTIDAHVTENLLLRLDNRADVMLAATGDDKDVFPVGVVDAAGPRDARDYQVTTTFGVIVHAK